MQGCHDDLGIVQRAIRDVFKAIEQSPEWDFLLRFSMMEIYNEVCPRSCVAQDKEPRSPLAITKAMRE